MSEEYQRLDIKKLTIEAENGRGCPLLSAITELSFDERFKVLKHIEANNAIKRIDDPSVPTLSIHGWRRDNRFGQPKGTLELKLVTPAFQFNKYLYLDYLKRDGTHTDSCADYEIPHKQ